MDLLTQFYVTLGLMVFSGGCGYYLGERGWQGVQSDLNNVKLDVAHIQGKLGVNTQTTQIITPSESPKAPAADTVTITPNI